MISLSFVILTSLQGADADAEEEAENEEAHREL
jgi:hypothetical protein